MRLVAKKALALLTAVSLVAPGLVGCVDFAVEQSTRARGQAATYASGYGAPPALPSFDYVPPEEPDFTSILGRPYAPAGAVKDGVSHGIVGEIPGFSHIGNDGTFNYNIP